MDKILCQVHKQGFSKQELKNLKKINEDLKLRLSLDKDRDLLVLKVIETSLVNKKRLEEGFEAVRREHFDMWDYLDFIERNRLLRLELRDIKAACPSFIWEDTEIFIPCFDLLLNKLYSVETAILELPQFFKLYTDFSGDISSIFQYQLLPFKDFISDMKTLAYSDEKLCLYDDAKQSFYLIDHHYELKKYPLWIKKKASLADIERIADLLMQGDELACFRYLVQKELIHPKAERKMKKRLKKEGIVL